MVFKKWLEADYADCLELINRQEARWRATGRDTRRNWWDVLAGQKDGTPTIIDEVEFPVLRAARRRKGWNDVPNAICRNDREVAADFRFGRWGKRNKGKLPRKAKSIKVTAKVKKRRA